MISLQLSFKSFKLLKGLLNIIVYILCLCNLINASIPIHDDNRDEVKAKRYKLDTNVIVSHPIMISQMLINDLPRELLLQIMSHVNQRDTPTTARVNKFWQIIMNDNKLWYHYLKIGQLIDTTYNIDKNYKDLFKFYCTPSFNELGTLNGGNFSYAHAINASGDTITGYAHDGKNLNQHQAIRWTRDKGIESLGFLHKGFSSYGQGISADGHTIVGQIRKEDEDIEHAFIWTQEAGMVNLDTAKDYCRSDATAISADGQTVIGCLSDQITNDYDQAYKWNQDVGFTLLGNLNDGNSSWAEAINANGKVIVGYASDGADNNLDHAYRWTQETGIVSIGKLYGGESSQAHTVSANGDVISGYTQYTDYGSNKKKDRAFIWTQETGMLPIDSFDHDNDSYVHDMAANGQLVVGHVVNKDPNEHEDEYEEFYEHGYAWTSQEKMQLFDNLLDQKKIKPSNLSSIRSVNAITPNGVIFTGEGIYGSQRNAWIAVIPKKSYF